MSDINDMFREICAHLKLDLKKMRANCKGVADITQVSLFLLIKQQKLRMEMDSFKDVITVWYQDHGQKPCGVEEGSEVIYKDDDGTDIIAEIPSNKSEAEAIKEIVPDKRFLEAEEEEDYPF